VADKGELAAAVVSGLQPGDLVFTLGAGDIWRVGEEILERLRKVERRAPSAERRDGDPGASPGIAAGKGCVS
jgi:hypothetical protein